MAEQGGWHVSAVAVSRFPVLSDNTAEHVVRRVSERWVLKVTLPGWYGQVPVIQAGKLRRVSATPAQYLDRLDLQRFVFGGEIKLLGFCVSDQPSLIIGEPARQPSITVAQPFYPAASEDHPSPAPEVLDRFMRVQGFLRVADSYFGWVRLEDGIIITDAKPDNFILAADGLIPIDLQIAQVDPEILRGVVVS